MRDAEAPRPEQLIPPARAIRQPGVIRDRVVSEAVRMCRTLDTMIGSYYPDEQQVLSVLRLRGTQDLAFAIGNVVMERFGAEPSRAKEPRFDKTLRAVNEKRPKGPRGGNGMEA